MEIFWYIIVVFMLCVFFILDGYDFGTGIIHLFFAKTEEDKKTIAKAAGLFWDSNEVWLVAAGGMLFMAFPIFYASAFSGFYLPLIIVLWLIIFRAIGLELRNQFDFPIWKTIWDRSFGVASLMMALFFGIALANMVRGVNLGGIQNGEALYEAHYFFLPLWNSQFSPTNGDPGVIDWFTIIIGIIAVVVLAIHGANWVILKTNSSINEMLKGVVLKLNMALSVLTVLSLLVWAQVNPEAFANFIERPYLIVFPLVYFAGHLGMYLIEKNGDKRNFLLSSMVIVGGITSTLASMFPVVLPSTNSQVESLTIYNTTTTEYGLSSAVTWWIVGFLLLIVYFLVQKRFLGGKIDDMEYGH